MRCSIRNHDHHFLIIFGYFQRSRISSSNNPMSACTPPPFAVKIAKRAQPIVVESQYCSARYKTRNRGNDNSTDSRYIFGKPSYLVSTSIYDNSIQDQVEYSYDELYHQLLRPRYRR